jgi:hypothetical protein
VAGAASPLPPGSRVVKAQPMPAATVLHASDEASRHQASRILRELSLSINEVLGAKPYGVHALAEAVASECPGFLPI